MRRVLELAAYVAAGVLVGYGVGKLAAYLERSAELERAAADLGRPPPRPRPRGCQCSECRVFRLSIGTGTFPQPITRE